MEKLFRLYRYLSQCKHRNDEDNSYNVALRTIELNDWDEFIARCQDLKATAEKAEKEYHALFEDSLDDHPF